MSRFTATIFYYCFTPLDTLPIYVHATTEINFAPLKFSNM